MGLIRRSVSPPEVNEGDVLPASIVDIKYPVEGKYTDKQGNKRLQIVLRVRFECGYETYVWIPYYERPSDKSILGQLILTLQGLMAKVYETLDEVFSDLKKIGIYVECVGFREWRGGRYPRFKIVPTKLPSARTQPETEDNGEPEFTLEKIREITQGWPETQRERFIKRLQEAGLLGSENF